MFFGFGPVSRRFLGNSWGSAAAKRQNVISPKKTQNAQTILCLLCLFVAASLFPIVLRQKLLNNFLCIFVPLRPGVAELDHTILIDYKMAGPSITEVVT